MTERGGGERERGREKKERERRGEEIGREKERKREGERETTTCFNLINRNRKAEKIKLP